MPECKIKVKAVPGASRDAIAGMLGDRIKVRVSAPPEGGKANAAICALIAKALGVRAGEVEIVDGHTSPLKTVRVPCESAEEALRRLGMA